jgi:hypothetical protein
MIHIAVSYVVLEVLKKNKSALSEGLVFTYSEEYGMLVQGDPGGCSLSELRVLSLPDIRLRPSALLKRSVGEPVPLAAFMAGMEVAKLNTPDSWEPI